MKQTKLATTEVSAGKFRRKDKVEAQAAGIPKSLRSHARKHGVATATIILTQRKYKGAK